MTNISIIENKLAAIHGYLQNLEMFKKYSRLQIEEDIFIRGATERYLYLAVQAAIDLSEAVISLKNFRKPTTLKEGFEILEEEHIISIDLRNKLREMVGFRNAITHDYAKINYDIVYDVLQNRLSDIEAFVAEIKKYLNLR